MEKRMEVLSRPVGGVGWRPITRKRVELEGLSSIRGRSTGTSYVRAASSEAMAATVALSRARSAAAEVEDTTSDSRSDRLALSHCRHWARAWGCEQTTLI